MVADEMRRNLDMLVMGNIFMSPWPLLLKEMLKLLVEYLALER